MTAEARRIGKGGAVKAAFSLFLLASSLLASAQLRARPAILPPVLRRALVASATLRFTGRRTVIVRTDGQTEKHEEIVTRDGLRTRIEFPSGAAFKGQIIVEDGKERRHFLPATNEVRLLLPRREEGLQRLRALAKTGAITTEPGDKVAGLATVEVVVKDGSGNLIQRLAVEPKSGMILRRRLFDATGTEIGGFVYTKVDLTPGALDPSLFHIERKGVQTTTPQDVLEHLAKRGGYSPNSLPASTGFRLDEVRMRKLPEGEVLVQNYVGPGGRLALFQFRASINPERLRRQGRNLLRNVSWNENGITFVLLGPQDVATLERLKASLSP